MILSSISSDLGFLSVNQTSIYEISELKVFKNVNILCEISNNWPNDLSEIISIQDSRIVLIIAVYKITMDNYYFRGTLSPFSSLVVLLLVPATNFIVSGVESSR